MLEQPPALGRPFAPADCERGAEIVIILSDPLWRTAFGSDPRIIGRTVQLNRQRATVVGVTAADAFHPSIVGGGFIAPLTAGSLLSNGDTRYGDVRQSWLTIVTGIVFGLVPALQTSQPDLHAAMKQDGAGTTGGRRGGRLRAALVGVQVALCMVLMIAAGLLLRGLHATYTVDPGFAYRDVAMISMESAFSGYSDEEAGERRRRLIAAVRELPGFAGIAGSDHKPIGDDFSPQLLRLPGEGEGVTRVGEVTTVSPDYFSVLELPIVRGRAFTSEDATRAGPGLRSAIITATTAGNLWPGGDAIGRGLAVVPPGLPEGMQTLQVVGVVADAQVSAIGQIDPYHVYLPGGIAGALLVKGRGSIATTVADIQNAARALDPTLLVTVLPIEAGKSWLVARHLGHGA